MRTMNPVRSVATLLTAVALLVLMRVSTHAGKPSWPPGPRPGPTVVVTGGIEGEGDAAALRVAFVDASFAGTEAAGSFIANPDYTPALMVNGQNRQPHTLRFYYCDSPAHDHGSELVCRDPSHDPHYYKCLRITGGIPEARSDRVTFPAGSAWGISWKETMANVATGQLADEVVYDVLE